MKIHISIEDEAGQTTETTINAKPVYDYTDLNDMVDKMIERLQESKKTL